MSGGAVSGGPMAVAPSNVDSAKGWDGPAGDIWTEHGDSYNRGVAAYLPAFLAAAVGSRPVAAVLDVGCGSGQTTRAVARRVGRVTGIDLSSRQLELARQRAAAEGLAKKVEFVQADAQIADLGEARYDRVVSRNGAQFFGDPAAAYANLARALRPGGRLVLQVWQDYDEQQWLRSFRAAVDSSLPGLHGVGPCAFGDPGHVAELLRAAGFAEPVFTGLREPMWFGDDAATAERTATAVVSGLIGQLAEPARGAALERLRADIAAHASSSGVTYPSAMWIITADRRG